MRDLKEQLSVAAVADTRILITGENGTGKELVARQIHNSSPRASKPFVDVNCAAIPEELIESELFGHVRGAFTGATNDRTGRFEQADGGTLFLDEIADMSLKTQAKVLRVLQEQKFEPVGGRTTIQVDVRVLAATNKDLTDEIREGRFREDLYFRLAVIPLSVPALRERRQDIPLLIEHFLDHFATELGRRPKSASPQAMDCLVHYQWPGNVRELRNLAERLMIMTRGDTIELSDLPAPIRTESSSDNLDQLLTQDFGSLKEARDHFESRYIEQQLQRSNGNVSRAARELGLERSNLYRKIKAYGIEVESFKA
jgi:two-component system nitrogen regulation response regulator NtrX